jgi:hypothetical protein
VLFVPTGIWPYYGGLIGGAFLYDPLFYAPYSWSPYWAAFYSTPFSPWYGSTFFRSGIGPESNAPTSAADPFAIDGPSGGLRLKIEPKNADVFVDGYYAGMVNDFNGTFQHVNRRPGPHHIEVSASGYETLAFDLIIQSRHTMTYRGALLRSP